MELYIKAGDFLNILSEYYSDLLKEKVTVNSECYYDYEGCWMNERKISKVRFDYTVETKILNHTATKTIKLSKKEIQEAFTKLIDNYSVTNINFEVTEDDRCSFLSFIGVTLTLKEQQKKLGLEK